MKNIFISFIVGLFLVLSFFSCSDDDQPNQLNQIGFWDVTEINNYFIDNNLSAIDTVYYLLNLKEDLTGEIQKEADTIDITWNYLEGTIPDNIVFTFADSNGEVRYHKILDDSQNNQEWERNFPINVQDTLQSENVLQQILLERIE